MLSASYLKNTIPTIPSHQTALRIVKGGNQVKRVVPTLRPVATILEGETGIYRGMLAAVVYPMPDGELVCVPFSGRGDYEYHKARYLPKDHPIVLEHARDTNVEIKVDASQKDDEGPLLNERDRAWLERTLEAQNKRMDKELRAKGLIP